MKHSTHSHIPMSDIRGHFWVNLSFEIQLFSSASFIEIVFCHHNLLNFLWENSREKFFFNILRQILISDDLRSKFEAATLKKNFLSFTNFSDYVTNTRKIKKNILVFRCYDGPTLLIYLTTKKSFWGHFIWNYIWEMPCEFKMVCANLSKN